MSATLWEVLCCGPRGQSLISYNMFRESVNQMTGGHGRDVVHTPRVEQSLTLGDFSSRAPVALERRRRRVVDLVVTAAADLEVGPVGQRPVVEPGAASSAREHEHGDQDGRVDGDDDGEVRQTTIRRSVVARAA